MEAWAGFVARRPWRVVVAWVAILVIGALAAGRFGGAFNDTFAIPGTESQQAVDILNERFPSEAGDELLAVFHTPDGAVNDAAARSAIADFRRDAAQIEGVVGVSDPFDGPGSVSPDRRTAIVRVRYEEVGRNIAIESVEGVIEAGEHLRSDRLQIEFGGQPVVAHEEEPPGTAEMVGIIAALIILVLSFGSILAAGMPVVTALVGLGVGFLGVLLAAATLDIATFAPTFGAMLGIGVGIDYALFVISRFREQLAAGQTPQEAARLAISTAGRAVAFAGTIVVVALLGLFGIGIPLIANLGLAAAMVVFVEMLVAVSLLPALLVLLGHRVDKWSIPGLHYTAGGERGRWYRFSRQVGRHPWLWLTGSTLFLLALAAPVLTIELGVSDEGNGSETQTSRRAYDLVAEGFGPGVNGLLLAVVTRDDGGRLPAALLERTRRELGAIEGVASVAPPSLNADGDTATIPLIPTTAPQDAETRQLVADLREQGVPAALAGAAGADAEIYIAGSTAAFEDITAKMVGRLPVFFAIVIGISLLLLMMAFRSILVPLKAAALNLLAIAAALGFTVMIFQWGWGLSLLGLSCSRSCSGCRWTMRSSCSAASANAGW